MILVLVPTKARQLESESQELEPRDLTLKPDTLTTLVQTLPSHNSVPLLIKGFPIVHTRERHGLGDLNMTKQNKQNQTTFVN
jgi:hypothetical protein